MRSAEGESPLTDAGVMSHSHPRPRVLIVDDCPRNLLALRGILRGLDVELVEAASGREALRHLLRQDFDLVLMDVVMSDVSGEEVSLLMRQRERTRNTPVVLVTADDSAGTESRVSSNLPVAYLLKPLNPEDVRARVKHILGRRACNQADDGAE